jgi:hypothetical protein
VNSTNHGWGGRRISSGLAGANETTSVIALIRADRGRGRA